MDSTISMWGNTQVKHLVGICKGGALGVVLLGCSPDAGEHSLSMDSASFPLGAPLPTIVDSVFPADDAVDAPTNGPLRLDLSQPVVPAWLELGTISLRSAEDGQLIVQMPVQERHVVDSYTVELWFDQPLELGAEYYVTISRDAVRVNAPPWKYIGDYTDYPDGNAEDPTMWNFTVGVESSAPLPRVVSAVSPADDATGVPQDASLTIDFNAPIWVDEWTGAIELRRADNSALVERFVLDWSHVSSNGRSTTVTPSAPLEADTEYYVAFDRTAVRINQAPWGYVGDYSGYTDGHADNPTMWNFSTGALGAITFADPILEAGVRAAINKPEGEILEEDVANLTELQIESDGITDLSGIEHLTSLRELLLYGSNAITDVSPLGALTNLRRLALTRNEITDISSLSVLTNLRSLYLTDNEIADVSPLSVLTNLELLHLADNEITDLSPLVTLTSLIALDISDNEITDLSPVAVLGSLSTLLAENLAAADFSAIGSLSNLRELRVDGNAISNIGFVSSLKRLTFLSARHNEIDDLTPLAGLLDLHYLYLETNEIRDLAPLERLDSLEYLLVANNPLSDLSAVAGAPALTLLDVGATGVTDLSPLASCTALDTLHIYRDDITTLSPLAGLTSLTRLYAREIPVTDFSPLEGLVNLTTLDLQSGRVADVSFVAGLHSLESLFLTHNHIVDVSPLAGLARLRYLNLGNNEIGDISPLVGLTNLSYLTFPSNQVGDISPLVGLTDLVYLRFSDNQVSDISPLLGNSGLGSGDTVELLRNPIDCGDPSTMEQLNELRARGVDVSSDC